MAEIINLHKHRKLKARAEKEQRAQENRAKFGRAKPERAAMEARNAAIAKELDGAKRNAAHEKGRNDKGGTGIDRHSPTPAQSPENSCKTPGKDDEPPC